MAKKIASLYLNPEKGLTIGERSKSFDAIRCSKESRILVDVLRDMLKEERAIHEMAGIASNPYTRGRINLLTGFLSNLVSY